MNKKDEKVIPTLDDIIQTGVSDTTQIGDLSSFDDGNYDAEFEEIYLTRSMQQQSATTSTAPRDVSNTKRSDKRQSKDSSAFSDHNAIADQIVAERFPDVAAQPRQNTQPAPTAAAPQTSQNSKLQTPPVKKSPAAPAKKPAPVTPANIDINTLVDEITAQLLPEIEWKIRTRVRDILEQYFPDKT